MQPHEGWIKRGLVKGVKGKPSFVFSLFPPCIHVLKGFKGKTMRLTNGDSGSTRMYLGGSLDRFGLQRIFGTMGRGHRGQGAQELMDHAHEIN